MPDGPNVIINQKMLLDDLYVLRSKLDDTTKDGRDAKEYVDRLIQLVINAQTDVIKTSLPRIRSGRS